MQHAINKSQRNTINRIIRFYRQANAYNGVTSVRATVEETDYRAVWISLETRRSDCGQYSPRAVVCRQDAHICVGPRGGITVYSASSGLESNAKHVAHMLRGKVRK